jgi:gliding motility associated protien GldN
MKKLVIIGLLCLFTSIIFAQNTKPVPKPAPKPTTNNAPAANNQPAQTTPTKTKVEPIYSIFQKSDQNKLAKEKEMGKTEKQCAPELPRVKSDDVIFAKRITRDIYFADPTNRYLVPAFMDRNLVDILLKGVESFEITAYQGYNSSLNKLEEPLPDTDGALKTLIDTKVGQFTPRQYGEMDVLSKMGLRVVEDWYFDTNRSEFKPFIISIGIIYAGSKVLIGMRPDDKNLADKSIKLGESGADMDALFYVNYPTIRNYLCKFKVYHPNEKIRYSFDDVFQLRYFSSLIIEESNPEGLKITNRADLKSGLDKLLEADRIKRSLIQYEQDMWEQ